ncbi:MAG: cytochrome c3 family protein, partial [Gammaproteobacteria bacterium]|nr:cytochrome c3 family protein [Gammaproteobacteria bacterium]
RERQLINEFVPQESATIALTTQARAYIERRVNEAAENLFERQTCTICHEITQDNSHEIPWIVRPVRLTTDWFPMAEFSHDSHKNMQCSGCHEAEPSALATDVLIPEIGSCRTCHGGEDASDRLQSSCITCHKFHLDEGQPMGAHVAVDGMGNPMGRPGAITTK